MEIECKGDWDLLKKILEEAPTENEYITYKGEKWIKENYVIPKQKVRDKIEELEEKSKKYQGMQGLRYSEIALDAARIQVLKELLEENK